MICYRCGAGMEGTVCPACGFDLHSPVEIQINRYMLEVFIAWGEQRMTVHASLHEPYTTVRLDCPFRTRVRIAWSGIGFERDMINGEAYRFQNGRIKSSFRLIRTRRIPRERHPGREKEVKEIKERMKMKERNKILL